MPALSKTTSNPQRQPPPSLFLGPPSRDASYVSLPSVLLPGAHASSIGAPNIQSHRNPSLRHPSGFNASARGSEGKEASAQPSSSPPLGRLPTYDFYRPEPAAEQRHADHAEALWAEMQSTLEDVELSATNDTHVFGPEHTKALAELRNAQIALAEAWAKSEMDEAEKAMEPKPTAKKASTFPKSDMGKETGSDAGRRGSGPDKEETAREGQPEDDGSSAQRQREENDRFFERINRGVEGVMAKLDDVASAMRAVERESRDVWSENATSRTTSIG